MLILISCNPSQSKCFSTKIFRENPSFSTAFVTFVLLVLFLLNGISRSDFYQSWISWCWLFRCLTLRRIRCDGCEQFAKVFHFPHSESERDSAAGFDLQQPEVCNKTTTNCAQTCIKLTLFMQLNNHVKSQNWCRTFCLIPAMTNWLTLSNVNYFRS